MPRSMNYPKQQRELFLTQVTRRGVLRADPPGRADAVRNWSWQGGPLHDRLLLRLAGSHDPEAGTNPKRVKTETGEVRARFGRRCERTTVSNPDLTRLAVPVSVLHSAIGLTRTGSCMRQLSADTDTTKGPVFSLIYTS